MFMVLGSESSGKSSLLERIAMIPIFPRDEKICTRMPIKIQLRRTSEDRAYELKTVLWRQPETGDEKVETVPASEGEALIREKMNAILKEVCGGLNAPLPPLRRPQCAPPSPPPQ